MAEVITYNANRIGGCVTLITAETESGTHRILIDYGSSLDGSDSPEDFRDLWEETAVDAVLFTHYHGDHVGRMLEIPHEVPIYMGDAARQVMINIEEALVRGAERRQDRPARESRDAAAEATHHRAMRALLRDDSRIHTFHWNGRCYDTIDLPGFHIEPYSVDHSAYDAYMFLIEAADKSCEGGRKVILHTGDFRGHGRRGRRMLDVVRYYMHRGGRKVDVLVTEGTMMGRTGEQAMTETDLQREATRYLKQHKYAFLICSSTNLDSLASFYRAAQSADGRHLYTYNAYVAQQLRTFTETAGAFSEVYRFPKVHVMDLYPQSLMEQYGFLALIKPESWCESYVNTFLDAYHEGRISEKPVLIYSMWEGYLDPTHPAHKQSWIDFITAMESRGVEVLHLHTSGHASIQMLQDMIRTVDPQEAIIPIHTEHPKAVLDLGTHRPCTSSKNQPW